MVWPWLVTIGLTLSIIVFAALEIAFAIEGAWEDVFIGWAIIAAIGIFICGVMGLSISIGRHYSRVECKSFHRTTARPTRFVIYTTFSWDCLTPTAGGKWIPTKNLREFGNDH